MHSIFGIMRSLRMGTYDQRKRGKELQNRYTLARQEQLRQQRHALYRTAEAGVGAGGIEEAAEEVHGPAEVSMEICSLDQAPVEADSSQDMAVEGIVQVLENDQERAEETLEKEDFLLKQIDEFREKAKQLQELLLSREDKLQELQTIVDEREERAEELNQVLSARQAEADELVTGVRNKLAEEFDGVKENFEGVEEQFSNVEQRLNVIAEKIVSTADESAEHNAEQTAQMLASLQEISSQLDSMKLELAEKIHTEDVKCYRNMQHLIQELTARIEENDTVETELAVVKRYAKSGAWFSVVNFCLGLINFVALGVFILYCIGVFPF